MITIRNSIELSTPPFISDCRRLLQVTSPLTIATVSDILNSIVGTAMVGHVSIDGLAAIAAGSAVYLVASQVLTASATGYQILAAKHFGANALDRVGTALWNSFIFVGALTFSMFIILNLLTTSLVSWITSSSQVIEQASLYIHLRSPGLFFLVIATLVRSTFNAEKQTKWSMHAALLGNICNVLLNYVFIFGVGPIPSLGAPGSALASTLSLASSLVFLLVIVRRQALYKLLSLDKARWEREEILKIGRLSLPMIGSMALDYIGNLIFFGIIGMVGTSALAANRIAFNMQLILFTISMSFSVGLQILIGQSWGANDLDAARRYLQRGRWLLLLVVGVIALPTIIWPAAIMRLFSSFEEIQTAGSEAIRITGFSIPLMAWAVSYSGALRALGRTMWDMISNVLPIWTLQLPLTWWLALQIGLGLEGAYIAFAGYWLARAIIANFLTHRAYISVGKGESLI